MPKPRVSYGSRQASERSWCSAWAISCASVRPGPRGAVAPEHDVANRSCRHGRRRGRPAPRPAGRCAGAARPASGRSAVRRTSAGLRAAGAPSIGGSLPPALAGAGVKWPGAMRSACASRHRGARAVRGQRMRHRRGAARASAARRRSARPAAPRPACAGPLPALPRRGDRIAPLPAPPGAGSWPPVPSSLARAEALSYVVHGWTPECLHGLAGMTVSNRSVSCRRAVRTSSPEGEGKKPRRPGS